MSRAHAERVDKMVEFYSDSLDRVNRINERMKKVRDNHEKIGGRVTSLEKKLDSRKEDVDNVVTNIIAERMAKVGKHGGSGKSDREKIVAHYRESLSMIRDYLGKTRRNSLKLMADQFEIEKEYDKKRYQNKDD